MKVVLVGKCFGLGRVNIPLRILPSHLMGLYIERENNILQKPVHLSRENEVRQEIDTREKVTQAGFLVTK